MNQSYGVIVASQLQAGLSAAHLVHFQVEDVHIINNTIAHNLGNGVHIVEKDSTSWGGYLDGVHLHNNLFARNNVYTVGDDSTQVEWKTIDLFKGGFSSDNNVYLAWPRARDEPSVIKANGNGFTLVDIGRRFSWRRSPYEDASQQTDDIADINFDAEGELGTMLAPNRDTLKDVPADLSLATTLSSLTYHIGADSICRDEADDSFIPDDPDDALADLASDIEGRTALPLDVGAYEV